MTRTARFRCVRIAAVLLVAAVAAGCDGTEPKDPPSKPKDPVSQPPVPPTSETTPDPEVEMRAPSVAVPLDASAFIDDPCQSLTKAQHAGLDLESGEIAPHSPGSECIWRDGKAEAAVSVHYMSDNLRGLEGLYIRQDKSDFYPRWEPTEVNGYPAVLLGDTFLADVVTCDVAVGLSDSLYFSAIYADGYVDEVDDEKYDENCVVARNIAAMVVENIKSSG